MTKILFVCLGNICRSPTAEGVMQHLIENRNLQKKISIDSAGTSGWHIGERADPRSRKTAQQRGFDLHSRSRKFIAQDFQNFDYIIAMDQPNKRDILKLAASETDKNKVHLFRTFDPASQDSAEVPDPYYGGDQGFETVFDICFAACEGLLEHLKQLGSI